MKLLAKVSGGLGSNVARIGRLRAAGERHPSAQEDVPLRHARFSAMTVSTCGSLLKIGAFAVLALILRALLT